MTSRLPPGDGSGPRAHDPMTPIRNNVKWRSTSCTDAGAEPTTSDDGYSPTTLFTAVLTCWTLAGLLCCDVSSPCPITPHVGPTTTVGQPATATCDPLLYLFRSLSPNVWHPTLTMYRTQSRAHNLGSPWESHRATRSSLWPLLCWGRTPVVQGSYPRTVGTDCTRTGVISRVRVQPTHHPPPKALTHPRTRGTGCDTTTTATPPSNHPTPSTCTTPAI